MRRIYLWVALAALIAAVFPAGPATAQTGSLVSPIVIGHRGASGYRPEHTLAAYELAIDMGADFVEPDLVMTKDGVLVARHENFLARVNPTTNALIERTTDVMDRPEFAARRTTKIVDGTAITGWFAEDFTLAELKTLRAVERIPQLRPQNTAFNGQFTIPTLQEVIDLVQQKQIETGRTIGIYPETKHPTFINAYLASQGLPSFEQTLVNVLAANGYAGPSAPIFIQSFEVGNLIRLSGLTDLPLAQLLDASGRPYDFVVAGDPRTYADLATPLGLAGIAAYADGIGANKSLIIPRSAQGRLLAPTALIGNAHAAGLLVHAWTFRSENSFLPLDFRSGTNPAAYGDAFGEDVRFLSLGLDGIFSDNPDTAVRARNAVVAAAEIPEPSSLLLLGTGTLGLLGYVRRVRRRGTPVNDRLTSP